MQNLFDTAECQESANRATAVRSLNHVNVRMPAWGPTQILLSMPCAGPVQQEGLAQILRQRKVSEYRKTRRGQSPWRALCPDPRTAPGPHKDKKGAGPAHDADQTAPPDNAPKHGEARKGRPPPLRYLLAPRCRAGAVCAATPIGLPATPLPPHNAERPAGAIPPRAPPGACGARIEKRPPRARRPALPQPGAAVLSAKAGLTAGFGMGPGDPRLCGRARGGRSPAASL